MLQKSVLASLSSCVSPVTFAVVFVREVKVRKPDMVDVASELFPFYSLSLSLSQYASLIRALLPKYQSATHVLLGRASVSMATVARPPVNLSSHDPRGGRALAGLLT